MVSDRTCDGFVDLWTISLHIKINKDHLILFPYLEVHIEIKPWSSRLRSFTIQWIIQPEEQPEIETVRSNQHSVKLNVICRSCYIERAVLKF